MRFGAITAGLIGALALATAAGEASAQSRVRAPTVTLSEAAASSNTPTASAQRRGLRWNENGRWGLNFNMNQPTGRETQWGDVEAGASYSVTPRLSVGAAAALGRAEQDPARAAETDRRAQPRIRLESIFRF
jgi:long-subunit fatty acid transport protein